MNSYSNPMISDRFDPVSYSISLLIVSLFSVPLCADVIVGTGPGGQGFSENQQGPDSTSAFAQSGWPRVNWSAYNNSGNAQTHPATGDVDGDGRQEVILGLSDASNGWFEVLDDQVNGFAHLKWLRVDWSGYNTKNGESWPVTGDVDGDNRDEIIVGLGTGSDGWMEIKDDAQNSFSHLNWIQVSWSQYTEQSNHYTRPAAGDVDQDGGDEIIVGLSDASNGWVEIKEDQSGDFDNKTWIQVNWSEYNANKGETRPATGDVDADGAHEIILGLGAGSDGWLEIKDDEGDSFFNSYDNLNWIQVNWDGYNNGDQDGTRPDAGNLDPTDEADEIIVGLSSASNGWMEAKQDASSGYSTINWTRLNWGAYNKNNGASYPVILPSIVLIHDDSYPGEMALDSSGTPHISYYRTLPNKNLKYASFTDGSWDVQTVDSDGAVGKSSSIAIDSTDAPHISYSDNTNGSLKYAVRTGGSWNIQTVDSNGDVGWSSSIVLDSSDNPHISYRDTSNKNLKYAHWTGSAWDIQTVDSNGDVGWWTSIDLDSSGNPHITHLDNTNDMLKYAKWVGSSWENRTVDSFSSSGGGSRISLVVDSSDQPHIAYRDEGSSTTVLKYAHWTGSEWDIDIVDSAEKAGRKASLALDSSGSPHIVHDANSGVLKYAFLEEGSWTSRRITTKGYTITADMSIAIDQDSNVHITYRGVKYVLNPFLENR